MSKGPSTFRKTDVKRAIDAVRSAGCEVCGVVIGPDGSIHVKIGAPSAPAPANDDAPDEYEGVRL